VRLSIGRSSERTLSVAWRTWWFWLLAALAAQYALVQLATGVEYLDAQRNMQWGSYVLEQPRFLIGAENVYDHVNGFPPPSPELAPAGMASPHGGPVSPWWGPAYLVFFAGVWGLTHSFLALQLIGPLAAGATVLLTYAFGKRFMGRRVGMVAAVLLALFPMFREHAVLALVEPLSAVLIILALWAALDRRPWLAALAGTLAMLGKPDMIVLFYGTLVLAAGWSWLRSDRTFAVRDMAICLVVPLVFVAPWFYVAFVATQRPVTIGGGPSWAVFSIVAPLMLEQFFTVRLGATLLLLGSLLGLAGRALVRQRGARPAIYRLLLIWLAMGVVVLLGYAALPSASNNPRVMIPALPALCLLVADGLERLTPRIRRLTLVTLVLVFVLLNAVGLWYQVLQAGALQARMPVWRELQAAPRGAVLTEYYWEAALYARQPATWFEHDPAFQRNIMQSGARFERYVAVAPIRYVVLPRDRLGGPAYLHTRAAELYRQLPLGRELDWPADPASSADVRAFLEQHFPQQAVGDFVIFTLDH
jgi:hypothetical protein